MKQKILNDPKSCFNHKWLKAGKVCKWQGIRSKVIPVRKWLQLLFKLRNVFKIIYNELKLSTPKYKRNRNWSKVVNDMEDAGRVINDSEKNWIKSQMSGEKWVERHHKWQQSVCKLKDTLCYLSSLLKDFYIEHIQ